MLEREEGQSPIHTLFLLLFTLTVHNKLAVVLWEEQVLTINIFSFSVVYTLIIGSALWLVLNVRSTYFSFQQSLPDVASYQKAADRALDGINPVSIPVNPL